MSLHQFLEQLSTLLGEAAERARGLDDPDVDLPARLKTRHIAKDQRISSTTAWRKAKLGAFGPLLSGPGEPIEIDRGSYLAHARRERGR